MQLHKYQALGNDYLIASPPHFPSCPSPAQISSLCNRHFGIGADGLLYGPLPTQNPNSFSLRIFNSDGSEAEKSGNGLRIFAQFLFDQKRVPLNSPFSLSTPFASTSATVLPNSVSLDIGYPASPPSPLTLSLPNLPPISGYALNIGNPHFVIPHPNPSPALIQSIGPFIENHPSFPNRTNLQLFNITSPSSIQLEIWERGSGYTLSSGSSSSAAAFIAHKIFHASHNISVYMPGGPLSVSISPSNLISINGPAHFIATISPNPSLLLP